MACSLAAVHPVNSAVAWLGLHPCVLLPASCSLACVLAARVLLMCVQVQVFEVRRGLLWLFFVSRDICLHIGYQTQRMQRAGTAMPERHDSRPGHACWLQRCLNRP